MMSGISRRAERAAIVRMRFGTRARAVGALVGALAAVSAGFAPSATAYEAQSKQWYLELMKTEQMWNVSTGEGVKIAVIDSGVNASTASLKGQVLTEEVPRAVAYGATDDYDGHGTTMAELIAGTGSNGGIKGLAPGAKIVPYRVEFSDFKGTAEEKQKIPTTGEAIRAAADTDAKIINMSFSTVAIERDTEAAIKYAASKGKLVVAAVGNEGKEEGLIGYPAAYPYVLGVAAADQSLTVSQTSSYGDYVDLAAPGEDLPGWCDATFRSYCVGNQGTSAASAIASAAAALIWSAHPDWSVNQVTRSLIDSAGRSWPKDKPNKYSGYGFIRPRIVLADAKYNAGSANVDPLAKDNGGDLLAKSATSASSSPSPSAPAASQAPEKGSLGGTSAAGSSTESSNDSNTLWIALGATAAVIVIGGAGVAVMRSRRAR